jgi:hypothetical protein
MREASERGRGSAECLRESVSGGFTSITRLLWMPERRRRIAYNQLAAAFHVTGLCVQALALVRNFERPVKKNFTVYNQSPRIVSFVNCYTLISYLSVQ